MSSSAASVSTRLAAPAQPEGPWALKRLAFASLPAFDAFLDEHRQMFNASFQHIQAMLSALPEGPPGHVRVAGVCDLCAARTVFTVPFSRSETGEQVFRLRDARCSGCGLPQRKR